MSNRVAVIDYGVSNLLNVARALEHIGATVDIVNSPKDLLLADRVVLPGVGAFHSGMEELENIGCIDTIREYVALDRPLLGICLGMQMMLDSSEEYGECDGLALVKGKVVAVPPVGTDGEAHKIPHMGWNELMIPENGNSWESSLLRDVEPGSAVYFVHSFMAVPSRSWEVLANCYYNGQTICAATQRDNVMGCQFHPEKSGEIGLSILKTFIRL